LSKLPLNVVRALGINSAVGARYHTHWIIISTPLVRPSDFGDVREDFEWGLVSHRTQALQELFAGVQDTHTLKDRRLYTHSVPFTCLTLGLSLPYYHFTFGSE
jgi:hypothetical protein